MDDKVWIRREDLIALAMEAANDTDWGYESNAALEILENIAPALYWRDALIEMELEKGWREMGPEKPILEYVSTATDKAL